MFTIHGVIFFFSQWKVKVVWRFLDILLPNKFGTFLICFMRSSNTEYLWQVHVCRVDLADLVFLCITRWSNIELKCVTDFADWFGWIFDNEIMIFDWGFMAWLISFLLEIMLRHLTIFPCYLSDCRREEKHEWYSEWVECLFIIWVCFHTLLVCVTHGILKFMWVLVCFEWTFVTKNWWVIARECDL